MIEPMKTNPWGLTDIEAAWMDAMLELGCIKSASTALDISLMLGQSRMRSARRRMGTKAKPIPAIHACIKWHEWTKSQAECAPDALCYASRDGFGGRAPA